MATATAWPQGGPKRGEQTHVCSVSDIAPDLFAPFGHRCPPVAYKSGTLSAPMYTRCFVLPAWVRLAAKPGLRGRKGIF